MRASRRQQRVCKRCKQCYALQGAAHAHRCNLRPVLQKTLTNVSQHTAVMLKSVLQRCTAGLVSGEQILPSQSIG
jgi:hypothetical protein